MVQKKEGWPEEGELVIATVTKIQYHSVFCNLDEYDKSGMIHISEIAPGRIKSIQEYVREGKTLVLKVLRLDKAKGHIDLSLRRVTEAQRRQKATQLKQQQLVERIVKQYAEQTKGDAGKIHDTLLTNLEKHYSNPFDAFQQIVDGEFSLTEAGFDKKTAEGLEALIKDRIKPKEVSIRGEFEITSYAPDGVDQIGAAFKELNEDVTVSYAGGGRYTTIITGPSYKHAEDLLKQLIDHVKEGVAQAEVKFERTDKK